MKIEQTLDCPVIDGHIHFPHPSMMPGLIKICDRLKIDRLNIVCTPDQKRLSPITPSGYSSLEAWMCRLISAPHMMSVIYLQETLNNY